MKNCRFYKFAILILMAQAVILVPPHANAQSGASVDCRSAGLEIMSLRVPNFDGGAIWKKNYGVPGAERAAALVELADGGFVAVGDTTAIVKDKTNQSVIQPTFVYLSRFDKAGKQIWEKRLPIANLTRVVKAAVLKDRIIVLSEIADKDKSRATRVDFYDGLGNSKNFEIVKDSKYDYVPKDVLADKGAGLTLALWAVSRIDKSDNFSVIAKTDANGKVTNKRQYLPGVANRLESITRLSDGGLIGAGQTKIEGGPPAGWVLRLSADGEIVFQRIYPRGREAVLRKAVPLNNAGYMVAGDAQPNDGSMRGAWIMGLSASGNPLWQKFITGKYNYSIAGLTAMKDGRSMVLMNGKTGGSNGVSTGGRDHTRIETFSQNGMMLSDEAYIDGVNAIGRQIIERDGDRLFIGMSQTGLISAKTKETGSPLLSYDLWLMAIPSLAAYSDPCAAASAVNDDPDNPFE